MKKHNLKKAAAGVMVMVLGLSLAGCGNATNSNSDTQQSTTATQETAATVAAQPTTAEVTTVQTTQAATQDVGVVPPNYKRSSKEKVLAFSKDTDFASFTKCNEIEFYDELDVVADFVGKNTSISILSGSKITLDSLIGYYSLSDGLKEALIVSIGIECGDSEYAINKGNNKTFAFVLSETNGMAYISLYSK